MKASSFKHELFEGVLGDVHYEYEHGVASITRVFILNSAEDITGKLGHVFKSQLCLEALENEKRKRYANNN